MSTETAATNERSALAAVTRGVIRIHAEYFGKGPTRARSERFGSDGLICIIRETLTPVEMTLIDRGQGPQVLSLRRSFQDAMAPEFRAMVEGAVGREVEVFFSQVNLEPDVSAEVFLLKPVPWASSADEEA